MRIGYGYDVHALANNRRLILGGVDIPYHFGLLGHSDADVLTHSIMDALLGAAALGDIGKLFPDTDPKYENCDSMLLLKEVSGLIKEKNYSIENIDSTIIAQAPKLAPFIEKMRENISCVLELDISKVNIKATTTEHLGFEGRKEGIASVCITLLSQK